MRSPVVSWIAGLVLAGVGLLVMLSPLPFGWRLVLACLTVFMVDALGGRWFGYASLSLLFVGLLNDRSGTWALMLPLVLGSAFAALVMRHVERGWLGVPFAIGAFMLPLLGFLMIRPRIDPGFQLPLKQNDYVLLHLLAVSVAVLVSSFFSPFTRRFWRRQARSAQARLAPAVRAPNPPQS